MENYCLPYMNYPDPRFRRQKFVSLDGQWDFSFQNTETIPERFERTILVPFSYETKMSGIGDTMPHEMVWYRREFDYQSYGRTLLKFGAVDYACDIFLNEHHVGAHVGGYSPFEIDLTDFLLPHNVLVIRVEDSLNPSQVRGKQRSRPESYECWYVQTTGIWKSVYLESVGTNYITSIRVIGDADGNGIGRVSLSNPARVSVSMFAPQGEKVFSFDSRNEADVHFHFHVPSPELWSFETPNLYQVEVRVDGEVKDCVWTYFGFRSISNEKGAIRVNGKPVYLKMILNQGYYPESGLTAPSQEALIKDFSLIKKMGFNGCRIHQKVEDPLFYYMADALGLFLWSELPSSYHFDESMRQGISRELNAIMKNNMNSPSIIVYVLFNESWGIPSINDDMDVQHYVNGLKKGVQTFDPSRLVITNDGWFQTEQTDILSLHEYEQDPDRFWEEYRDKDTVVDGKIINHFGSALAKHNQYRGQPVFISEFGGASLQSQEGWGYGQKANDLMDYLGRLKRIFKACQRLSYISGYCYTQLTDVEQETNGLLYPNREPKLPLDDIRAIVVGEVGNK